MGELRAAMDDEEEFAPNDTQKQLAGMDAGSKKDFLMNRGTANIFDLVSALREDRASAPRKGLSWEGFGTDVAKQYRSKAQYQYGERLMTPAMIIKSEFPDGSIPAPFEWTSKSPLVPFAK